MTVTAKHETRWIGRSRKVVTVVQFSDGVEIAFTERMSKADAIRQALDQRERHPEYWGAGFDRSRAMVRTRSKRRS